MKAHAVKQHLVSDQTWRMWISWGKKQVVKWSQLPACIRDSGAHTHTHTHTHTYTRLITGAQRANLARMLTREEEAEAVGPGWALSWTEPQRRRGRLFQSASLSLFIIVRVPALRRNLQFSAADGLLHQTLPQHANPRHNSPKYTTHTTEPSHSSRPIHGQIWGALTHTPHTTHVCPSVCDSASRLWTSVEIL